MHLGDNSLRKPWDLRKAKFCVNNTYNNDEDRSERDELELRLLEFIRKR